MSYSIHRNSFNCKDMSLGCKEMPFIIIRRTSYYYNRAIAVFVSFAACGCFPKAGRNKKPNRTGRTEHYRTVVFRNRPEPDEETNRTEPSIIRKLRNRNESDRMNKYYTRNRNDNNNNDNNNNNNTTSSQDGNRPGVDASQRRSQPVQRGQDYA